jgi:hypothetical protein
MRLALALFVLLVSSAPVSAQTGGKQSARTAYGYRLTAPEEDDDPADGRAIKRLNTRVNNRLETRIERYRFVDTRSGTAAANPYAPRPSARGGGCVADFVSIDADQPVEDYSAVRTSSSSGNTRCSTTLAR